MVNVAAYLDIALCDVLYLVSMISKSTTPIFTELCSRLRGNFLAGANMVKNYGVML